MKKIYTVAMALVSVGVLAACNGRGSEVKQEEFVNKANAIQLPEKAYVSAEFEYSVSVELTAPNKEGKDETKKEEDKGKISFTFDEQGQATGDKNIPAEFSSYAALLKENLKDLVKDLTEIVPEGYEAKFYVAPFGVSFGGEIELLGAKTKLDAYVAFNDYGFVSKMELNSTSVSESALTGKTTTKINAWFTVSYK